MDRIFRLDSPLILFFDKIGKLLLINLLWLLCSLPIVTIGASTAAMYYVLFKIIRNEDAGIIKSFLHSFKDNFLQCIPITLIFLFLGFLIHIEFVCCLAMSGTLKTLFLIIFFVFALIYASVYSYVFPLQSHFSNSIKQTHKNAFILSLQNLKLTSFILILHLSPILFLILWEELFIRTLPLWVFLAPAFISWLCATKLSEFFLSLQSDNGPKDVLL